MVATVVVLPAPLRPNSTAVSPSSTSKSMPMQHREAVADRRLLDLEQRHQSVSTRRRGLSSGPGRVGVLAEVGGDDLRVVAHVVGRPSASSWPKLRQ